MAETRTFECTRCGACCSKIRGPMLGSMSGLMILPSEVKLFPIEAVKPLIRNMPAHPFAPNRVWMYQVDGEPCPRYDAGKKTCKIYERRPLVCRAFPFELSGATGARITVHGVCPEAMRFVGMRTSVLVPSEYFEAASRIHEYYTRQLTSMEMERFDLEKGWRNFMAGVTAEDMKIVLGKR